MAELIKDMRRDAFRFQIGAEKVGILGLVEADDGFHRLDISHDGGKCHGFPDSILRLRR